MGINNTIEEHCFNSKGLATEIKHHEWFVYDYFEITCTTIIVASISFFFKKKTIDFRVL